MLGPVVAIADTRAMQLTPDELDRVVAAGPERRDPFLAFTFKVSVTEANGGSLSGAQVRQTTIVADL